MNPLALRGLRRRRRLGLQPKGVATVPDFAVLRIAKISNLKGLSGAAAHNTRTASAGLEHADGIAPRIGGGVHRLAGQDDAVEAWHKRARAVRLAKPRRDAVRAIEAIMSASPEWFSRATPEVRNAWSARSIAWVAEAFGTENILSAHLHDDEATPHIHVLVIPLAQKKRKKAGRPRKGREGRPRPAVASWGLSAADLIGSPDKLSALQTAYAAEVADLGIRRGRARRATGARHRSAAAYRAEASEHLDAAYEARIEASNELGSAKGSRMFAEIEATQIITDAKQSAAETATAFTVGLDAVDAGELVYCPGDGKRPEGLVRQKVDIPQLPPDRSGFFKWKEAVRPLISRLVGYARRLSLVATREQEINHRSDDLDVEAEAIRRVANRQVANEKAAGVTDGPAHRDVAILTRDQSIEASRAR